VIIEYYLIVLNILDDNFKLEILRSQNVNYMLNYKFNSKTDIHNQFLYLRLSKMS